MAAETGWRASLAWGLVGGLSFLVLLQGYELLTPACVDFLVKGGVALAVTVGATILTAVVGPRLRGRQ